MDYNKIIEDILSEREDTKRYGNAFELTKDFWNIYINKRVREDSYNFNILNKQDVAIMMILMKIARNLNIDKDDNILDIIGYAKCYLNMKNEN